jgi:hypothetical protein
MMWKGNNNLKPSDVASEAPNSVSSPLLMYIKLLAKKREILKFVLFSFFFLTNGMNSILL